MIIKGERRLVKGVNGHKRGVYWIKALIMGHGLVDNQESGRWSLLATSV
jgi:hypothetical protein